jgi:murein DD-endopeptidase MepM/ murein hydrolase activator NlpD
VTGVVTQAGEGKYGTIGIRDANGRLHQILHTHSRSVAVGDPVVAGQLIGRMGDTGVVGSSPEHRRDHAHYQLFDPAGKRLNPTEYWDQQGRVDPNPASPARLDDYQRYIATPGAVLGDTVASAPTAGSQTVDPADAAAEARKKVRVLGRLVPGRADLGGYDANAPATMPNQISTPDRSPTFAERFGSWVSSPTVTAPLDPYQPIAPQPQSDKPPGIVTGQPMPNIPLPPWVFGLPDPSEPPGNEAWSLGRLGRANWNRK